MTIFVCHYAKQI